MTFSQIIGDMLRNNLGARVLLDYVRTINLPTDGQAFDWDMSNPSHIWTIERKKAEMVESSTR